MRVAPPAAAPTQDADRVGALARPAEPGAAPGLVDLNSASLAELNGLRGGGQIGRAIMRGRPYGSPEDLLAKRILNRTTYQQIKDQVTVR
jgi:DNA uptake protein ComE-like DNA-binding protein